MEKHPLHKEVGKLLKEFAEKINKKVSKKGEPANAAASITFLYF